MIVIAVAGWTIFAGGGSGDTTDRTERAVPAHLNYAPATQPPRGLKVTSLEFNEWKLEELRRCMRITNTPLSEAKESGSADYNLCADAVNRIGGSGP